MDSFPNAYGTNPQGKVQVLKQRSIFPRKVVASLVTGDSLIGRIGEFLVNKGVASRITTGVLVITFYLRRVKCYEERIKWCVPLGLEGCTFVQEGDNM